MLKFIPVRGRKREGETHRSGIRVEIYPREGTETRSVPFLPCAEYMLKFIPVRGRKHISGARHRRTAGVEIYPREGTETRGSLRY